MIDQEILDEIRKLTNNERLAIIEEVLNMIRKDFQQTEQERKVSNTKQRLKQAAKELLADYMSDDELTAFNALDGEDFHA
jgi:hypothetical protein